MKNSNSDLLDYAKVLRQAGLSVAFPVLNGNDPLEKTPTWFIFGDGVFIGYVQKSSAFGFSFSTLYKPSKEFGSGEGVYRHIYCPNVKHAIDTMTRHPQEIQRVKLYQGLDDYIEKNTFDYKYLI